MWSVVIVNILVNLERYLHLTQVCLNRELERVLTVDGMLRELRAMRCIFQASRRGMKTSFLFLMKTIVLGFPVLQLLIFNVCKFNEANLGLISKEGTFYGNAADILAMSG